MEQGCGTCQWAKWSLTAKGNIRRKYAGTCLKTVTLPMVPFCVEVKIWRTHIWVNDGTDCPCFERKEK